MLERFGVFCPDAIESVTMQNIATKDQATVTITDALLNARDLGEKQAEESVRDRMIVSEEGTSIRKFAKPLKKNKAPTFSDLYMVPKLSGQKSKVVKADRTILQRLIVAYEAEMDVHLNDILKHELMSVPLSLAQTN